MPTHPGLLCPSVSTGRTHPTRCCRCRAWGQDSKVVEFLKAPAKPRKGLPSRPIVGTAVSIQLDLDQAIIDEFFPAR